MISILKKIIVGLDYKKALEAFKRGGLYFGTAAIGMVLSFFTFPIFSKFLSEKEFAIFNYFNNMAGFFVFAFSLQFASYYSANYFRCNEDEKKELTGTLVSFLLLWNTVIVCVVYGILILYCKYINLSLPYYPYLIFSLLITAITIFQSFFLVKLRLDENAFKYFLISASHKLLVAVIGVSLMYLMYNHLAARFWGWLIAEIVLFAICVRQIYKIASFKINRVTLKKTFKFIYPLIIASLIYYPVGGFDQMVLERLNKTSELGYYSLGLTFASYLYVLNASMMQAVEPNIIKCIILQDFSKFYKIVIALLSFCLVTSIIFIQISKYLIAILTNGRFVLSAGYCNVFAVSFIFVIIYFITNTILIALRKNKAILYTNLIGCLSCICIYIFNAHFFGFYGVAVGRVIIYILMSFVAALFIYREFKKIKDAN
jgi:O-antigen/teichoic acid export membrane protein